MRLSLLHPHRWDLTPADAIALQRALAAEVRSMPLPAAPRNIAGIDVSIRGDMAQAAVVVLRLPELTVIDSAVQHADVPYPYVPGLLSFRELPVILPALEQLRITPEVIMTDAHGICHPRRFGLACHLGIQTGIPTFGVAKNPYIGTFQDLRPDKSHQVALLDAKTRNVVGAAVRTRSRVRPVFVSIGHGITLSEAVDLTLACSPRYRIPEPTRLAHLLSRKQRAIEG